MSRSSRYIPELRLPPLPGFDEVYSDGSLRSAPESPASTPDSEDDPKFKILSDEHGSLLVVPFSPNPGASRSNSPGPQPIIWPPPGLMSPEIGLRAAKKLIGDGASRFRGKCTEVPFRNGHYHHYCLAGDEWDNETDCRPFEHPSFDDMSNAARPMESLDRPYMRDNFGIYSGSVTLSSFAASFGSPFHGGMPLDGGRVKLRKLNMMYVISRLRQLKELGIEQDEKTKLYHDLYANLVYDDIENENDPKRFSINRQIDDLIDVLSRRNWVDFSKVENHIIPDYFYQGGKAGNNSFFHQLVFSIELLLRMNLMPDAVNPMADPAIPVKVKYDLVVAERWLDNVEIDKPKSGRSGTQSTVNFSFQNKNRQIEVLRNFGWTLKWPNMPEVEFILSEEDEEEPSLEDRSVECMSWFTGLIMPGKSMPWILMNALIGCDPDAPDELLGLSHLSPNTGLQWRGSSYWSYECIVGKVMGAAKGVKEICGWLGPVATSNDPKLGRSIMNQIPPLGKLGPRDIQEMEINSAVVPSSHEGVVHVDDFEPLIPNLNEVTDTIRFEKLNYELASGPLKKRPGLKMLQAASQVSSRPASSVGGRSNSGRSHSGRSTTGNSMSLEKKLGPPPTFDVSITFAIGARSWRVKLLHDISFIAAYPCHNGPHVLHANYDYCSVRPDNLMSIKNWGMSEEENDEDDGSNGSNEVFYNHEVERVLVIEAFGVHDNAVFSRAWCSFWGLSAIVADIDKTCMACCVREAYAASVKVVILHCDRLNHDNDVEDVDRTLLEL